MLKSRLVEMAIRDLDSIVHHEASLLHPGMDGRRIGGF